MTLEETLNDLLVKLFKDILEIEAKSLITEEFKDISVIMICILSRQWELMSREI